MTNQKRRQPRSTLLSLLLATSLILFFSSCKTTALLLRNKYTDPQVLPVEELCPQEIVWQALEINGKVDNNFQLISYIIKKENVEWKCLKIDLDAPNLEIEAAPYPQDLGKRFYLKDFSKKYKLLAAVNTVPFDLDGRTYIPVSIVKIDNEEICPINEAYSALAFSLNPLRARIIKNQSQEAFENYPYAFGGFFTILQDGQIFEFEKYKRSRTAVGTSEDGRYLYLFACCGINCPTGRNGLNFEECALILQKLGAQSAMEFDGGHSSGLTIKGQNAIKPSLQRKVPAAFGLLYKD
ncbi:MAG: phosphodiester glycosidase family protein [Treponema sp.]|nr:phosphodiester glycosidase family protein [Treponema sp.]